MRAETRPYLDEAYPALLCCLAVAAEKELAPIYGEPPAIDLAFRIAEGVRSGIGGNFNRLPAVKEDAATADLFGGIADTPRPSGPPEVTFNESESNVDMIEYARGWAAWIIADHDPATTGNAIHPIVARIISRFHRDASGRDQTYIPRGARFDNLNRYRTIYSQFTGRNYAYLAIRHHLSEMRIRQIVEEFRAADLAARQARLDPSWPIPPQAQKKAR